MQLVSNNYSVYPLIIVHITQWPQEMLLIFDGLKCTVINTKQPVPYGIETHMCEQCLFVATNPSSIAK